MMSNAAPAIPRLGIPKYDWWSEALHGVANADHATVFPQAIGLAAMWNENLQREIAGVIGIEGRAKFNGYKGTALEGAIFRGLTFWSPNVNIFRDPRWGRGQETYGEDPFLTSRLGVAFVRGLQGDDPDHILAAACAKHFAVHSGPEPLRHYFDAAPPDADLYETYLPAFEALAREADVEVFMMAYNSLYGSPCSVNPLLYALLREWGFDGHVTSDCGSVADLGSTYFSAADPAQANAMVLRAGMDLRCGDESAALLEAARRGLASERELDESLGRLLRTLFRLGLFDPADRAPFRSISPERNDAPEHGELALEAARQSMVLLKNDGLLPLDPSRIKSVAVIGPNASSVPSLLGNYNGSPSAPVTVLEGLRRALEPTGVSIDYAHGCDYAERPTALRELAGGWYHGEYFANDRLEGEPAALRTERPLSFDFGAERRGASSLPSGVPDSGFSVRWKGDLQTTLPGEYTLAIRGRGGFRLIVDGETLLDAWTPPAGQENAEREVRVARALPGNASLPLKIEYRSGGGAAAISLLWATPEPDADFENAVRSARSADAIVFVGGISAQLEGEEMAVDYDGYVGGDRSTIELPKLQLRLLQALRETGKPIVFVNLSGSAIAMPWAAQNVDAILQAWYPGQAGGAAVADVLLGNYNPAGRLPVTFYRSTEDLPPFEDYDMSGRTYRYFEGSPLYPFGHGLSYTRFEYSEAEMARAEDGSLVATVTVKNVGDRDGDEVVQVYATPPADADPRERHALCGFRRIHLKKGESARVRVAAPASALRRWSENEERYVIPAGAWSFGIGASSADIRLRLAAEL